MMDKNSEIFKLENIQSCIFSIRGMQVMVDRDLAELYQVVVKRLNEQVKRNIERFPKNFRFQLTNAEKNQLVANCDRFKNLKHSSANPYVFTEQGVAMLSAVLRSETAVKVSIQIMQVFVGMRKFMLENAQVFQRLDKIEIRLLQYQGETEDKFNQLFDALETKELQPKQGVFYNGQIFDAYILVADIIRSANKSIIIIDNYVDDTVLQLLTKRKPKVWATIYTKKLTRMLKQDLDKHNAQYEPIGIKKLGTSHDRFMIIDRKTVYHFGASLKDVGKKWFAFSKLDIDAIDIIGKLSD